MGSAWQRFCRSWLTFLKDIIEKVFQALPEQLSDNGRQVTQCVWSLSGGAGEVVTTQTNHQDFSATNMLSTGCQHIP